MLELHRSAVSPAYEPIPNAPRLTHPPDALFTGSTLDGMQVQVYVAGHALRPAPFTLEVRVYGPAHDCDPEHPEDCEPDCVRVPGRWLTLPELADVVNRCAPRGAQFVLPFVSQGWDAELPDSDVKVLFLNQIQVRAGGLRPQPDPGAAPPRLVGA